MELLAGRYGAEFMGALHREDDNGLVGLEELLRHEHPKLDAARVLQNWAAAVALNGVLDDGARLRGDRRARALQVPTLGTSSDGTPRASRDPARAVGGRRVGGASG